MKTPKSPRPSDDDAMLLRKPLPCPVAKAKNLAITGMSDDEIQHNLEEISQDIGCMNDMRAEIAGETALYGDGPVGSQAKLQSFAESEARLLKEEAALGAEWDRRHPKKGQIAIMGKADDGDEPPF